MTTTVRITHGSPGGDKQIHAIPVDAGTGESNGNPGVYIEPGRYADLLVHGGQCIRVSEVQPEAQG